MSPRTEFRKMEGMAQRCQGRAGKPREIGYADPAGPALPEEQNSRARPQDWANRGARSPQPGQAGSPGKCTPTWRMETLGCLHMTGTGSPGKYNNRAELQIKPGSNGASTTSVQRGDQAGNRTLVSQFLKGALGCTLKAREM